MNRKRVVALFALAALIASGAFAQLTFGVTGALHMDERMSASEIQDAFESGENIFYGAFGEIIFGQMGFGVSGNFSTYKDIYSDVEFMDYDVNAYVSYHLFGGRAFLDPFGELGFGMLAYDFANEDDEFYYGGDPENPLAANLYWYGALGFGVNLGGIGIFGKFAYNVRINKHLTYEDEYGNEQEIPYYGYWAYDETLADWVNVPYLPKYRFTLGAKLIL